MSETQNETAKKYSKKKYYDDVNVGKRTKQAVYFCEQEEKPSMLELYVKRSEKKQTVILVKSKRRADELSLYLNSKDIKVTAIHGNHRREQVDKVAQEFNSSEINILITTDKILQSLELKNIETIINYDLPSEHENYFASLILVDEVGESISFVSPDEEGYLAVIEMRLKAEIEQVELEGFEPTQNTAHKTKEKKKKPRHRKRKTRKEVKSEDKEEEE